MNRPWLDQTGYVRMSKSQRQHKIRRRFDFFTITYASLKGNCQAAAGCVSYCMGIRSLDCCHGSSAFNNPHNLEAACKGLSSYSKDWLASWVLLLFIPLLGLSAFMCIWPTEARVRRCTSGKDRASSRVRVAHSLGHRGRILNQDKRLLREISFASEQREWDEVMSLFASYSGESIQIYTAVMNAALRCRKYAEGATCYERCRQTCQECDEPVFATALKIFGRLQQPEKVRKIWAEANKKCKLSEMLVSSRLQAAADEGDVQTAAAMLDLLNTSNLEINVQPITMAIRSCWGMGTTRHRAAKYFWDLFPKFGLKPTIVSFTALVGSYTGAPLEYVLSAKVEMESLGIHPDRVFAETYLVSLLQLDFSRLRAISAVQDALQNVPSDRLHAARRGIADFEAAGVEQTTLCRKLKTALENLKL